MDIRMKKTVLGLLLCALFVPGPLTAQQASSERSEGYYHFGRAKVLEARGDWEGALEAYQQALEMDPTNSTIYSEIAAGYMQHGQFTDALEYAERAARADQDNIEAHRLLSSLFVSMISNIGSVQGANPEIVDRAIEALENTVRLNPRERQANLTLGQLYRFKNEPERATAVYRDFLDIMPDSEQGAIALAELQMEASNVEEAITILSEFTDAQPDSKTAWATLGEAYASVEDFDKAADAFEQASELDPLDRELLSALAQALFFAGRMDEAGERYILLVERTPDDPTVRLRLAQILQEQMRYDEARKHMERAVELVPDSAEIQFNLALLNRDSGRFTEAMDGLDRLLDDTARPNNRYTEGERQNRRVFLTHLGILHSLLERYDEAAEAFGLIKEIIRDRDGTVDAYIVDTYRAADQAERALDLAEVALAEFPDNRQLRVQRADLIAEQGEPDEGVRILRELADPEPDTQIYAAIVGIHQREKNFEAAQDVLDEARAKFDQDEQVHFLQGALYERQKEYGSAENAFRRALEINADNPAVLNYLGYMLADNDTKLDEALQMVQKAVESDPINGAYLDSLGWVYFRLEQLELAEQYLKRALLFSGSDPTIHEHLGDVYLQTGRIDEARAAYERSLELAEEEEERDEVRKKLEELQPGYQ